ncbi:hypothetical protein [Kibdelosporangium philippinense]|uniref:hypothetical protein n=1 Tax=Kibdelosporangium philippinense TaxID=211113 RepID=UPI00360CA172
MSDRTDTHCSAWAERGHRCVAVGRGFGWLSAGIQAVADLPCRLETRDPGRNELRSEVGRRPGWT